MSKKQSTRRGSAKPGTDDVEGNVDKIRDILFGSQMRDFEQRLEATEKRLLQAIEKLGKDVERRVERLDKYARREVEKLSEQIKAERKDRVAESRKGSGELTRLADQFEAGFVEVDEQLAAESRSLRNTLLDQAEELTAQIGETQAQLLGALEKETGAMRDGMLAREEMAALLTEVAMRLNKDFKLPKG